MLAIQATNQSPAASRTVAPAPAARATAPVYQADRLQLTTTPKPLLPTREGLKPWQKIALMASPVVAGAAIGFYAGGPLGALAGAGIGAAVSVVGLWWALTDKPWGNKPGDAPEPPPPNAMTV